MKRSEICNSILNPTPKEFPSRLGNYSTESELCGGGMINGEISQMPDWEWGSMECT